MDHGITTEPSEASAGPSQGQAPSLYTRNSSGMVREISVWDMIAYNAGVAGSGLALAIGLFFIFAAFPGANIYIALPVALLLVGTIWLTFSLLMATFPRAGGDYLFGSRVLHPVVGLWSNGAMALAAFGSFGLWGMLFTTVGLAPTFTIIGVATGHTWWVEAGETISQKGWTLAIGIGVMLLISVLSILRTKLVARVITWSMIIGTIGFLIAVAVMLFTSHNSFVDTINSFSEPYTDTKNTYDATIAEGEKLGVQYPSVHGYSFESTIGAIGAGISVFIFYFWGGYMAGEMKGAGRRSRQLMASLGSGYVQCTIIILAAFLFIDRAGYDFFAAANSGAYGVPVSPYYNYFASIVSGSPFLSVLMGLMFLGFLLPAAYINSSMAIRSLFAWSFDGVLPRKLSSVSERTATPVIAITVTAILGCGFCALIIYSSSVLEALVLLTSLNPPTVLVTGIAGLMLPRRLPHLYENGPANWRLLGVPVLPVASAGCVLLACVWGGVLWHFHSNFGVDGFWTIPLIWLGTLVVAGVWYAAARSIQASRGVELRYVYGSIPPE